MSPRQQAASNREDSKMFGWLTYEGQPCPHCQHTERYTSNCMCVHCRKENNRKAHLNGEFSQRKLEMKARLVEERGGACERCGLSVELEKFEFHHIDPTTKETYVAWLLACSYERVKAEADKCQLVCRECHEEIHGERKY